MTVLAARGVPVASHCVFGPCRRGICVSDFVGGGRDSEEVGKGRSAAPWASAADGAQVPHLAAMFTFLVAIRMLPKTELVQPEGFYGPLPRSYLTTYYLTSATGFFRHRGGTYNLF